MATLMFAIGLLAHRDGTPGARAAADDEPASPTVNLVITADSVPAP